MPYIALDDIISSGPAALEHYVTPYGMLHACWAITTIIIAIL